MSALFIASTSRIHPKEPENQAAFRPPTLDQRNSRMFEVFTVKVEGEETLVYFAEVRWGRPTQTFTAVPP
jgi:hypothetical protein